MSFKFKESDFDSFNIRHKNSKTGKPMDVGGVKELTEVANEILQKYLDGCRRVICSRHLEMPDQWDSSQDFYVWRCEEKQPFEERKTPMTALLFNVEEYVGK